MQIPDDVSTKDALFLPNVETALSLIMDARIHPGENVCVIGQGMVGLLVVSLLRHTNPYARILSLDPNKARRDISHTNARAHVTLDPTHATFREDLHKTFPSLADVSIEVSASSSGLQTAIDTTRDHGRVVVGSWFGEKGCVLGNLGGRFHRSHMTLVSSQVSSITPVLGSRWDKERRFALVWKLIRDIKPISVFPVCVVGVERAGEMYERLLVGDVLQVIFEYAQA